MKAFRTFIVACAVVIAVALLLPGLITQAATMLNYGQPADGIFGGANQPIEYTFQGKTGDKVTIPLESLGGDCDPFLQLYDPQGKLIGEDDNGGGKDNALISGVVLQIDGTYKIVASNKRQGTTGKYSLIINPHTPKGPIYYDGPNKKEAYQLSQPWDHTNVTYTVANGLPNASGQDTLTVIQEAFQAWASVTPLTFQRVTSGRADIQIQFGSIDGPLNILGETCPPSSPCAGQVQFDSEEDWTLRVPQGYDNISFLAVATHEFGHAIGLLHSSDSSALMYPSYSPYNLKPGPDDIRGAQRLYGAGTGGVTNPTSVPPAPSAPSGQAQIRGTINDGRFRNFWDFDVDTGDTITITMKRASGDLDSFLVLLDANNHILAYDDDSAGGKDAVLRNIRLPQRGTYTIAATRYQQAQGYTNGDYNLTIDYGVTNAPAPAATTVSQPGGQTGNVRVSSGQVNALQQYPSLDTTLDTPFNDTPSPITQSRNATVQRGQTYVWDATWCARDAATLNNNLQNIAVTFAVDGRPVDANLVSRNGPQNGPNGLSCMTFFVLLSDWAAGQVSLTKTLTLRAPVYDGTSVYSPGDYIYQYTVNVR
jgi:predicted Zn-dependent protease